MHLMSSNATPVSASDMHLLHFSLVLDFDWWNYGEEEELKIKSKNIPFVDIVMRWCAPSYSLILKSIENFIFKMHHRLRNTHTHIHIESCTNDGHRCELENPFRKRKITEMRGMKIVARARTGASEQEKDKNNDEGTYKWISISIFVHHSSRVLKLKEKKPDSIIIYIFHPISNVFVSS